MTLETRNGRQFPLTRRRLLAVAPLLAAAGPPPPVHSFASATLRAAVAPTRGAELTSLQIRRHGRWLELLYRGGDFTPTTDFEGRAPILWPATGRNFISAMSEEFGWTWQGRTYPMPIHGFARAQAWRVARRTPASVGLVLKDTAEIRRYYPFGFIFSADYVAQGESLTLRQRIVADRTNTAPMPFSIGNHIAFRVPLLPGGSASSVLVETPATRQIITDSQGRPTGEVRPFGKPGAVPLGTLAPRTAYSMGGYRSGDIWARLRDAGGLTITVRHTPDRLPDGEPVLFNLWGDPGAGFFSPEPWVGKQNSLASGDGLIRLEPGSAYIWTIAVEVTETA